MNINDRDKMFSKMFEHVISDSCPPERNDCDNDCRGCWLKYMEEPIE